MNMVVQSGKTGSKRPKATSPSRDCECGRASGLAIEDGEDLKFVHVAADLD